MGVEDRDWYKEISRKRYEKWLNDEDKDLKEVYYNPKEFRGKSRPKRKKIWPSIIFWIAVLLVLFGISLGIHDYRQKGLTWRLIEAEGEWRFLDKRTDRERDVAHQVERWSEERPPVNRICQSQEFVNIDNANKFLVDSEAFLKRAAESKRDYETGVKNRTALMLEVEKFNREAQSIVDFYNRNLTKCYSNPTLMRSISTNVKSVSSAVSDLQKLLNAQK